MLGQDGQITGGHAGQDALSSDAEVEEPSRNPPCPQVPTLSALSSPETALSLQGELVLAQKIPNFLRHGSSNPDHTMTSEQLWTWATKPS